MVPAARISAQAAEGYAKLSTAASEANKLNSDAAMTSRVRDIAARLISHVGVYRPDARDWNWQVNVFESEQINAFCMPGGKIGVFSGLITKLELSDTEIAAVVGHEIAHALREHTREKVSQQTLSNAVVQGIANSGSRNAGAASALTSAGALLFLHLPFSRDMELEADVMGLELMARGSYDPRLASAVWEKMQRRGGSGGPAFFRTHPTNENRIAAIEAAVPKVLPLYLASAEAGSGSVAPVSTAPFPAGLDCNRLTNDDSRATCLKQRGS